MEILASINQSLTEDMWASLIHLKDTTSTCPFIRVTRDSSPSYKKRKELPAQPFLFGQATAPKVFMRVTQLFLAFLVRSRVMLYAYLDNWIILTDLREEHQQATQFMIQPSEDLGWVLNHEKSQPVLT